MPPKPDKDGDRCECACHFPLGEKHKRAPLVDDTIATLSACPECAWKHPKLPTEFRRRRIKESDDQC